MPLSSLIDRALSSDAIANIRWSKRPILQYARRESSGFFVYPSGSFVQYPAVQVTFCGRRRQSRASPLASGCLDACRASVLECVWFRWRTHPSGDGLSVRWLFAWFSRAASPILLSVDEHRSDSFFDVSNCLWYTSSPSIRFGRTAAHPVGEVSRIRGQGTRSPSPLSTWLWITDSISWTVSSDMDDLSQRGSTTVEREDENHSAY